MDVMEKQSSKKRLIDANKFEKSIKLSIQSWGRDCNSNAPVIARTYMDVLSRVCIAKTVDAVEVVRCKDCKNWHEETGFCEKHSYFVDGDGVCCSPADSPNWTMFDPDDFCSYGERKEGADNEL